MGALNSANATRSRARDDAITARDTAARRFRHLATGSLPADSGFPDMDRFTATLPASERGACRAGHRAVRVERSGSRQRVAARSSRKAAASAGAW